MAWRLGVLACTATLLAATAASCALAGYDFDKGPPGGGAEAAGGHGGAGTAGAGAGAGGGQACKVPADCPGAEDECGHRECQDELCLMVFTAADTELGSQTPQDCKVIVCDGMGQTISKLDPSDPLDDANECTDDVCEGGVTTHAATSVGTKCGDMGMLECDGLGHCAGCMIDTQCGMDTDCTHFECVSGVCDSMAINAGKDCGVCQTCQGGACANAADGSTDSDCTIDSCHPGVCNGNGGCKIAVGAMCGPASCDGDTIVPPSICDGSGNCNPGTPADCSPYTCAGNGAGCTSACSTAIQCADSHECDGNTQTCVDCTTCKELLADPGTNVPVCYDSKLIKDAFIACICGPSCNLHCGANLCMKMAPSLSCTSCINNACGPEYQACAMDTGDH